MDAVNFMKESIRMCRSLEGCDECPLEKEDMCVDYGNVDGNEEKAVLLVEQWSKEHPIVTNWQKFQEVFGTAIDPVTATVDWWSAEYKEPKGEG